MGQHITKYKKDDSGKIRRDVAETKKANKKGAAEPKTGADNKNSKPGTSAN